MAATPLYPDTAELSTSELAAPLRIVACAARTDRGIRRKVNEDAMLVAAPLLAVADGVGGHRAGEEASALTLDVLRRNVRCVTDHPERELRGALQSANEAVRAAATVGRRQGMATTLVAVIVGPTTLTVAHVGDSRAYLLRDGRLTQLTDDHSLVSALLADGTLDPDAARTHPMRSAILRAVGLDSSVSPDVTTVRARDDDVVLLCSDGLSDPLEPALLERLIRAERDLDHLVEHLAVAARKAGGDDDVTAVAARLG
jgi:protein phosphatase